MDLDSFMQLGSAFFAVSCVHICTQAQHRLCFPRVHLSLQWCRGLMALSGRHVAVCIGCLISRPLFACLCSNVRHWQVMVPFVATGIFERTGSYRSLYWATALLLLLAAVGMLQRPPLVKTVTLAPASSSAPSSQRV
jgi:hypothetical protein